MLTLPILKVLEITVEYADVFGTIPYQWDKKRGVLNYSERGITIWYLTNLMYFTHLVFIIVRYTQAVTGRDFTYTAYVSEGLYVSSYMYHFIVQVTMVRRRQEILCFVNRYVQLFRCFQGKVHIYCIR